MCFCLQPFDAVTAQGRVATVAFILTALVVVPLQLSTLQVEILDAPPRLPAPGMCGPACL